MIIRQEICFRIARGPEIISLISCAHAGGWISGAREGDLATIIKDIEQDTSDPDYVFNPIPFFRTLKWEVKQFRALKFTVLSQSVTLIEEN